MAPPYIQVPSGDNDAGVSLAVPKMKTAHMATTTLRVEGMT